MYTLKFKCLRQHSLERAQTMNYEWQTPFRLAFEILAFLAGWTLVAIVLFLGMAIIFGLVSGIKKGMKTLDIELPKKKQETAEPEKPVETLLGVVPTASPVTYEPNIMETQTMNLNMDDFYKMNKND